ncbi:unnamed protein product [Rotaria sordida]|uniref:Uncharacterized protein n=1 Tax=Rotaria sordida TaxID=392033 RepID=A0A818M5X1_9BILA|nr:unnamed protein product [Rotaria sordida]CAF3585605.1 unnamed protein product [Rotaria sordida]
MGNKNDKLEKSRLHDINNNLLNTDIYDTSWIEAFEKSFSFVWCDASIGTQNTVDDDKNTITQLARIINQNRQLVHTFNELDACREFITHVDNVCLIISGTMGEELVPLIHNLEQIHSIYIFCFNREKHLLWSSPYRKVRGVFNNINDICESLKSYVSTQSLLEYDRLQFDVISNEINSLTTNEDQLRLIYSKLNRIILFNMDSSDRGKQHMINYCRDQYKTENQIELINDFEQNYSKHSPIWWYTKNYFFQGIINRALRTHDLYALCSMHRYIKDLDLKVLQLNESKQTTTTTGSLNLYFGQFLLKSDFDEIKQNVGGLMCINQCVSANSELSIALMYIEQQQKLISNTNIIRVIFQIHIDRTKESIVSYANIGFVSQFVHEKEYLISMLSVYRINKIEKLLGVSSAWLIQITLIDKNDKQYNNLIQCINEYRLEKMNLTEIGYTIWNRLNLFKSTNKLFKQVLYNNPQELREIILHYNMGIIYDSLCQYEKSLNEYRKVLHIAREYIPSCYQKDDLCLVSLFSNMAAVFEQQNHFSDAFTHAFRALEIVLRIQDDSILKKELESSCYYNLGLIHDQEEKLSEAKNFYEQALRIRQEYLPLGHLDVTILQKLITSLTENRNTSF